jgi:His/Glu/Gln/Arg/opine family amino acid ABC transporter permease subunit
VNEVYSWLPLLAAGLEVTAELALLTFVIGVPLALLLAIGSMCPVTAVRFVCQAWVEIFRSMPLLALLLYFYYGLGRYSTEIGLSALQMAIIAMALSESAYLSAVYRGVLESVPAAQWDAAKSLGTSWISTMFLVVIPQSIRPALPGTMNALIFIVKDSSLASVVAVNEVTLVATEIVSISFEPLKTYSVLAVLYLLILIPLGIAARLLERWSGVTESRRDLRRIRGRLGQLGLSEVGR